MSTFNLELQKKHSVQCVFYFIRVLCQKLLTNPKTSILHHLEMLCRAMFVKCIVAFLPRKEIEL